MANEPVTTIIGNLTADPELRVTPNGRPVASFTIANTPRYPDRESGEWKDAETWFLRCSAWGDLAENVIGSLSKGTAVLASGRLQARTWEKDGQKHATVEMTVDDIGPSLRRNVAKITKVTREHDTAAAAAAGAQPQAAQAGDQWSTPQPAAAWQSDQPPF